ncbi:MAG: histidine phosphatase family protein [Cellvibrionaceae bacterium]
MIDMEKSQYRTTNFDLLRHGECEDGHCYRGSSDVALTNKGLKQMEAGLNKLNPIWHRVVSSPLLRCSILAKKVSAQHKIPLALDKSLQEMHFGQWEGQAVQKIWDTQQTLVEAWGVDPVNFPPPDGEAADIFAARVETAFQHLVDQYVGENILLVTHGGVIRVLLAYCLSLSLSKLNRFNIPYACVSRIQVISDSQSGEKYYQLLSHNMAE